MKRRSYSQRPIAAGSDTQSGNHNSHPRPIQTIHPASISIGLNNQWPRRMTQQHAHENPPAATRKCHALGQEFAPGHLAGSLSPSANGIAAIQHGIANCQSIAQQIEDWCRVAWFVAALREMRCGPVVHYRESTLGDKDWVGFT